MDSSFETLAKKICEYCMRKYVIPYLRDHGVVMGFRAEVVSKNTGTQEMTVIRPFDGASITFPYSANTSAASLTAGDQCFVLSVGESLNSVVVSDGMLNL